MVTVEEVRLDIIPLQQSGSPDSANHTANTNSEENIPVVPEKPSGDGYNWQKYGQRGSPDSANLVANANREETFPVVPEKPSEDGYNWRKYGQKSIKGNKNIRSYYRCSYQKCLVKKQVERAPDGRITDTSYFGMHEHPKPQTGLSVGLPSILLTKVQTGDKRSSVASEANDAELKETNELAVIPITVEGKHDIASPSSVTKDFGNSDDNVASKRRKTGDDYDMSMDNKLKSRWVVETISAVDIVNDGYRWRKYGQKLVKDNPNARSYYRCTNPGCPAKKRVERASHDPKVVITTYDGHHDHDVPQGRTLLPHSNSPAPNISSGHNNNSVNLKDAIRAQSTAAISKEVANTTEYTNEKDNTPAGVNLAQTSVAICKQERAEMDDLPEEVNQTQSSAAIKQGNTIDHPAEKDNAAEEEVKQAESSAPKQERGKTIDLPAKNDDPPEEVNQNESGEPICNQEQVKTIDPSEEVNEAQNSAIICKREEEGNTTDHSAEKEDPPEEVDQAHSIDTSGKQEGNTADDPAEETGPTR